MRLLSDGLDVFFGPGDPIVPHIPRISRKRQHVEIALVGFVECKPVNFDTVHISRGETFGNGRPVAAVCLNGMHDLGRGRRKGGAHK